MKALVDAALAISKRDQAASSSSPPLPKRRKTNMTREERLALNRTAASESRRRKREMVEDLQRSVTFFSKANASLKSRNAELERQLVLAKQRVFGTDTPDRLLRQTVSNSTLHHYSLPSSVDDPQAQAAHFSAAQAMFKSMGFPPAAARQAACTFSNGAAPPTSCLDNTKTGGHTSNNDEQSQAAHFIASQVRRQKIETIIIRQIEGFII